MVIESMALVHPIIKTGHLPINSCSGSEETLECSPCSSSDPFLMVILPTCSPLPRQGDKAFHAIISVPAAVAVRQKVPVALYCALDSTQ